MFPSRVDLRVDSSLCSTHPASSLSVSSPNAATHLSNESFSVNTTPQMTYFLGVKSVQKCLQVKVMMNCYSMTTRCEFGHEVANSQKLKIYECVTKHNANANDNINHCVELHDTDTNEDIHAMRGTSRFAHHCPHPLSTVHTVSGSLGVSSPHIHAPLLKGSSLRHASHLHIHVHVCGLFNLILPF